MGELLSTSEVATMLHCAPSHVSRLADRAGIEPARVIPRGHGRPVYRWGPQQVEVLEQAQVMPRRKE